MELKRASIITPPVTPRNSMLLGLNQVGLAPPPDQKELQDFLRTLIPEDESMSIPEIGEEDRGSTTSGTSTEGEDYPMQFNTNNNNNSNNNNDDGVATPTHFPMIGALSSSGSSLDTLGDDQVPYKAPYQVPEYLSLTCDTLYDNGDKEYSYLEGAEVARNLREPLETDRSLRRQEYYSEDPLYATPIVGRSVATPICMATPVVGCGMVPPTNMAAIGRYPSAMSCDTEVKKQNHQYSSLANLADDSQNDGSSRYSKEHYKSLENIMDTNAIATTVRRPGTIEKKAKRKLFGFSLWRKSSSQQMDTDSPIPLIDPSQTSTPLTDTSPFSPVPIPLIPPHSTRFGHKSISYV